jgi:hypothetical protein
MGSKEATRRGIALWSPGKSKTLGAVFRYEVVAIYRAPIILIAAVGAGGLARAYHLSRRRPRAA